MTEYRIRCVNAGKPHSHIVSAEVQAYLPADRAYGERTLLLVATIVARIGHGDSFNTHNRSTHNFAEVNRYICDIDGCKVVTLRSGSDAVADNNLDNLICS
jgi:hypothetical protein